MQKADHHQLEEARLSAYDADHVSIFEDCCPRSNPVGFYLELELALETAKHQSFDIQPDFIIEAPEISPEDPPYEPAELVRTVFTPMIEKSEGPYSLCQAPTLMNLSLLATFYAIAAGLALFPPENVAPGFSISAWLPLLCAGGLGLLGWRFARSFNEWAREDLEQSFEVELLPCDHWMARRISAMAKSLGLPVPAVGLIHHANAFVVASEDNQPLVAIGLPLIRVLEPEEFDALIGHHLAQLANGTMVQAQLALGYVAHAAALPRNLMRGLSALQEDRLSPPGAETSFSRLMRRTLLLGPVLVLNFLSRRRIHRADTAGAALTSPQVMIAVLRKLSAMPETTELESRFDCMMMRSMKAGHVLASHPKLEKRISAIESDYAALRLLAQNQAEKAGPRHAANIALPAFWLLSMLGAGVSGFFAILALTDLMPAWQLVDTSSSSILMIAAKIF